MEVQSGKRQCHSCTSFKKQDLLQLKQPVGLTGSTHCIGLLFKFKLIPSVLYAIEAASNLNLD